ncbi:MAG: enoyl-CoA hydratase/isomerase family protein [Deltaproteobacteria bacterium]|uniref:Enoyl-CoA hydratase/isomerase family protein n=1 Tax=Candidatus Zymogenus saltonus TaxID=2844893 RepID=A0A9D8KGN3_9DELT|nr:enoyl-CoA hydratase/isomerase family protein [Candidatus Zymogenus saltonus]
MADYGVRLEYSGENDRIAIVTIDRPEKKNVFDEAMFNSLEEAAERLEGRLPRVVVLTGRGEGAFSAGFDVNPDNPQVSGLIDAVTKNDIGPCETLMLRIKEVVNRLVFLPIPIICAINGIAYGGGAELAVRCDMRVMDPKAVICFSEVKLGLMPDWGGGPALTRLVGPAVAADLILTARRVKAEEALRLGIANRISEGGSALKEAVDIAETISKNGPRAVRSALSVIREAPGMSLNDALDLETKTAAELTAGGECVHGITAFLAKKEPEFPDE